MLIRIINCFRSHKLFRKPHAQRAQTHTETPTWGIEWCGGGNTCTFRHISIVLLLLTWLFVNRKACHLLTFTQTICVCLFGLMLCVPACVQTHWTHLSVNIAYLNFTIHNFSLIKCYARRFVGEWCTCVDVRYNRRIRAHGSVNYINMNTSPFTYTFFKFYFRFRSMQI